MSTGSSPAAAGFGSADLKASSSFDRHGRRDPVHDTVVLRRTNPRRQLACTKNRSASRGVRGPTLHVRIGCLTRRSTDFILRHTHKCPGAQQSRRRSAVPRRGAGELADVVAAPESPQGSTPTVQASPVAPTGSVAAGSTGAPTGFFARLLETAVACSRRSTHRTSSLLNATQRSVSAGWMS